MNDSRWAAIGVAAMTAVLALAQGVAGTQAAEPALTLRAAVIGGPSEEAPFTIELFRWSTETEREPLMKALTAPPPAPPPGRPGRAGGRGGRGGRGAPPPTPTARLTDATKAAPTVGFIWGGGPTGYSIKYAWRSTSPGGQERIVLMTARRVAAAITSRKLPSDADFTLIEMRLDSQGMGEGKMSLSGAVVDTEASTLALDGYAGAPAILKVTR